MASTPHIVISGLVLRETETKETDKILTLLPDQECKITASARGCRKKGSPIVASSQLLA